MCMLVFLKEYQVHIDEVSNLTNGLFLKKNNYDFEQINLSFPPSRTSILLLGTLRLP